MPRAAPDIGGSDARSNRSAALLSIVSNTTLTLVKLVLGLITGSVAVLSEAAHSASDLAASAIAFFAVRAAARPADHDHQYGHEKAENLAAAVEGLLVLAAGVLVAVEAVRRLVMGGEPVVHLELAIAVMFGSALVNVIVGRRLHRVARRTGSPAIEGDALHLSADVWTSAGTGAGLVLVLVTGWEPLDSIVALAVAAYVTWMGAALTHRAARELTDHTPHRCRAREVRRRRGELPRDPRPSCRQQAPHRPAHGGASRDHGARRACHVGTPQGGTTGGDPERRRPDPPGGPLDPWRWGRPLTDRNAGAGTRTRTP